MINGIGRQVAFGLTREELSQKFVLPSSSGQNAVASSPVAARSFEQEENQPPKSHTALYIALGTVATVTALAVAGIHGKLGPAQEQFDKQIKPFYEKTVRPNAVKAWQWAKGLVSSKDSVKKGTKASGAAGEAAKKETKVSGTVGEIAKKETKSSGTTEEAVANSKAKSGNKEVEQESAKSVKKPVNKAKSGKKR